ncbi:selenocysteine insertion sequence-binding protein 2-like [Uloborus diversus]|uniref:selenocysteine insertion sequence-binding protein 2-like n=1 Tax=Uloborus diversus TaxID=327109 RepID=UPI00240980E7|nr:selenocysteine insertion sequence-binding protein 2-like [Uloborus diversus]
MEYCRDMQQAATRDLNFMANIVTGDETWCFKLKVSQPAENVPRRFSIGKKTFSEFIPGVPVVIDTNENTSSENTCWAVKCEEKDSTEDVLKDFSPVNEKSRAVPNAWSRIASSADQNPKHQQHLPNEHAFKHNKKVPTNCKGKNSSLACEKTPKGNVSVDYGDSNAWSHVVSSAPQKPKQQQQLPNEKSFKSNKKIPVNYKDQNPSPACKEMSKENVSVEYGDNNAWSRVVSSSRRNPESQQHLPTENSFKCNKIVSTNCKGDNPSLASKEMPKKGESIETDAEGEVKKKRKRKSKIKRQAAMRSGKISLVTPEIHFKITNQTKYSNNSVSNDISTNIHDSEEYPELGKVVDLKKTKPKKKSIHFERESLKFITSEHELSETYEQLEESADDTENAQGLQETSLKGAISLEAPKEAKKDQKSVVHPNDPITISFFDMLAASKPKVKENHEKRGPVVPTSSSKASSKMVHSRPHNLLDSKPVVKRGKEREVPKAKRPSHMKKIILMDRKTRREQRIQLKNSLNESKQDLPLFTPENNASEVNNNMPGDSESTDIVSSVNPLLEENIIDKLPTIHLENSTNEVNCGAGEAVTLTHEDSSSIFNSEDEYDYYVNSNEDPEQSDCVGPLTDHNETEKQMKARRSQVADSITLKHIQMLNSMFGFTMSVKNADLSENSCCTDEERLKASKILIHTRNFREYCNHLPSQEIDDAVSALLADLVRFQDRMHQKDPVKARMKRRLTCGIKEVKKHLKLRKVKCVILATDVENVQTEGGLNDVLCDLKQAAADHQIPCIFALRKKMLGRLCHKPVGVSCIGVFNYEGSEVNFKKMIELLNQSKEDYEQILKGVRLKLSDEDIKQLIRARLLAPESLMEIRTDILRKTLLENPKIEDMPNVEVVES